MKRIVSIIALLALMLTLAACGSSGAKVDDRKSSGVDELVSEYGYQWTDPNAPILNDKGAQEISFNVYSSKNASALDYNDMKIMQDLFDSTNVFVSWSTASRRT